MRILGNNVLVEGGLADNINTMLIGAPGTGKTRSYVLPNLMSAEDETVVVLDPKGEIYDMTAPLMEEKGYRVLSLDFVNPEKSEVHYNPLRYCRNEEDIIKLSTLLVEDQKSRTVDMFWPLTTQLLCNALVGFLKSHRPENQQHLGSVLRLLQIATVSEENVDRHISKLDAVFQDVEKLDPNSWAASQYTLLKRAAAKTQKSIIISLVATFSGIMTPQMTEMMSTDNLNVPSLCEKKTVLYVKCSDTDRSKDKLVSLFFMQLFQELYRIADEAPSHVLPRPVHILLDDVGANLKIPNMDGIIATSRGRRISLSLILQSIGQLKKQYEDYTSILNSCNNVVFLGGSDIETCMEMSQRLDKPLGDVLYKKSDTIYVFRQGHRPVITTTYNLKNHPRYSALREYRRESDNDPKGEMSL
ncbi:MAG: type IV secretory system conjugative DNA transfer family protein [Clostridia bacterium]|nr:type IV secretory system conjugative DNA transfer family protein [Clostridia bacterium]